MRLKVIPVFAVIMIVVFLPMFGFAQAGKAQTTELIFQDAIRTVERRDYDALANIISDHPEVLLHTNEFGNDLFHEFVLVIHDEPTLSSIDFTAIETLLDNGAIPRVSNGLLTALLLEANRFGSQIEALPIEGGDCIDNRRVYFPIINRLISVGAEFGELEVQLPGQNFSEAYFYQYQLCFRPLVCGEDYEIPTREVRQIVSKATNAAEKDFLLRLVSDGGQDIECLRAINEW